MEILDVLKLQSCTNYLDKVGIKDSKQLGSSFQLSVRQKALQGPAKQSQFVHK